MWYNLMMRNGYMNGTYNSPFWYEKNVLMCNGYMNEKNAGYK